MDTTITLAQLWRVILALSTGIISISGATAVIYKIVHKAKQPEVKQNERITALEKEIKSINERLEKGDQRFDLDQQRMNSLEKTMKETNKVIIESLQALTAHAIDNSKVELLEKADKSLNDYLRSRI